MIIVLVLIMMAIILCISNKEQYKNRRKNLNQGGAQSINVQWQQWIDLHRLCYIEAAHHSVVMNVLGESRNIFGNWWQYKQQLYFQKYQLQSNPLSDCEKDAESGTILSEQQQFEQQIHTYIQLQSIEYDKNTLLRIMGYSIINSNNGYIGLIYTEAIKQKSSNVGEKQLIQQLIKEKYIVEHITKHMEKQDNWIVAASGLCKLYNYGFKLKQIAQIPQEQQYTPQQITGEILTTQHIEQPILQDRLIGELLPISTLQAINKIPATMHYKKCRQFKDPYLAFAYSYLELIVIKGEHHMDYLYRSIHNGRCRMFDLCNIYPAVINNNFTTIRKTIKQLSILDSRDSNHSTLIEKLHSLYYFGTFSKQAIKKYIMHVLNDTKQLPFREKLAKFEQSINNRYTEELLSFLGRCMYIRAIQLTMKKMPQVGKHLGIEAYKTLDALYYPQRRELAEYQLVNVCESAIASMMGTNICSIFNISGKDLTHTFEPIHDELLLNMNQSVSMIIQGSNVMVLYSIRNYIPYGYISQ